MPAASHVLAESSRLTGVFFVVLWLCRVQLGVFGAETAALTVNQAQVSKDEFRWFMEQERSRVFAEFRNRHGVQDGRGFWQREVGGSTPRALLQTNTVARIIREKVEQGLFQELSILPDASYAALLAEFQRVAQEREQAVRQGQAVYGPVRYTQLQFYEHRKALLRVQAIAALAQKCWQPTELDLRTFYDQHREQFSAPPSYSVEILTLRPRESLNSVARDETVRAAADVIQARLAAGDAVSSVLAKPPEARAIAIATQRFTEIGADRLGELFSDGNQLAAVQALAPGRILQLADSESQVRVVRCVAKTAPTFRPYEAVQALVRSQWLDFQYHQYLANLARHARVRVNQEVVDKLLP